MFSPKAIRTKTENEPMMIMKRTKDIDYKIISELLKNSRISDRVLGKKLGVSQPTISRRRARLEKEGLLEYTAVPNLGKLGFEIMALSFSKWTSEAVTEMLPTEEFAKNVRIFFSKHPNVIFATTGGQGLEGMDSASISIHTDYSDYSSWVKEIKANWGKYISKFESYIISLRSAEVVRQISFKHFGEYMSEAKRKAR